MFNLDQSQWAHNLSNANDKYVRQITVELSPKEIERKSELMIKIIEAIRQKRMFGLYGGEDGMIIFDPVSLWSKQTGGVEITYDNEIDFINGIKLAIIYHDKIHVGDSLLPEPEEPKLITCQ